ncbi:MAG: serine/threonine protein kinase [Methanosarcinaceae archaeon]|nr:serine/threonine protein kinase [Methanosarcinaceae archaeon]
MIGDVLNIFNELKNSDFRILTGIELGMRNREWVPVPEILQYTNMSVEKLIYRLDWLRRKKLVVRTYQPYEGYRIYFEGYDALALNAYVRRGTFDSIGVEIGVGKESVVLEVQKKPTLPISSPETYILKLHREGQTSFKQVKRTRDHISGKEHISWIYASRLAAQREFEIMKELWPEISIPKPIDCNRHTIVMEIAKGNELYKSKLEEPNWHLDLILKEIQKIYSHGIIHADLSEYNIFVSEEGIQIIDWPQYVSYLHPNADELLKRDVSNILSYFSRKYGIIKDINEVLNFVRGEINK